MKEQTEARNISMYPGDWQLIDDMAQQTGVRSTSGALRLLLARYRAGGLRLSEPAAAVLSELAAAERRTPDAQASYMLEHTLQELVQTDPEDVVWPVAIA